MERSRGLLVGGRDLAIEDSITRGFLEVFQRRIVGTYTLSGRRDQVQFRQNANPCRVATGGAASFRCAV